MVAALTVVAIYDIGPSVPLKVAEFRLTTAGRAVLTVTDPRGCLAAKQWFERGIKADALINTIAPAQGEKFLRALLHMPAVSYFRVVDEGPHEIATSPPAETHEIRRHRDRPVDF
ncbi:hypothetical protein ACFXO9_31220 [Nocardia tengchongensis]|uniref:hypothetical protein n=1 Tax=Nocardia tengchongensis TaxID=2055889 RepID=UPI00369E4DFE